MGGILSNRSKKETPGRPAKRRVGERIGGPRFEPCGISVPDKQQGQKLKICIELWQPDEQQGQKLMEMVFDEVVVRIALEAVDGDEILAIKMLFFAECARAGNYTNTKLWQPDEQQVQKLVETGFAEAAVRSALEVANGDEILAIKMLHFAECA